MQFLEAGIPAWKKDVLKSAVEKYISQQDDKEQTRMKLWLLEELWKKDVDNTGTPTTA